MSGQSYFRHDVITSLAMCAPPVRMVVVEAYSCRENVDGPLEDYHSVLPVFAIVGTIQNGYQKQAAGDPLSPPISPTHDGMIENGWEFDDNPQSKEFDLLIEDNEFGFCLLNDESRANVDEVREVVLCAWPPEEDANRLAPVIERLRKAARYKAKKAEPPNRPRRRLDPDGH